MFGVCATVKRTRSLDTPSNVTNQLQLFDDDIFDDDPYNQKENFTSDGFLDNKCCHDNKAESHPVKLLHDSNTSCYSHTMVTRTGGIKKSVQLFNSPYMSIDDEGNPPAVGCSNKKRKMLASDVITIATSSSSSSSSSNTSRPSRNNSFHGNKVSIASMNITLTGKVRVKIREADHMIEML